MNFKNPLVCSSDRFHVKVEERLWCVLDLNKVEEVKYYPNDLVHPIRITPKSKSALEDEPLIVENENGVINTTLTVKNCISFVAFKFIKEFEFLNRENIEAMEAMGETEPEYVVTFYTKNKRIIVDELGV